MAVAGLLVAGMLLVQELFLEHEVQGVMPPEAGRESHCLADKVCMTLVAEEQQKKWTWWEQGLDYHMLVYMHKDMPYSIAFESVA